MEPVRRSGTWPATGDFSDLEAPPASGTEGSGVPAELASDGVSLPDDPDGLMMLAFAPTAGMAGPATGASKSAVPKSYPLAGDPVLDQVAKGTTELGRGAKGASVEKLQVALELAGYKLRRFGADGDFGAETAAAVSRLQKDSGLPETGKLDAATLAALETRSAAKLQYPEYGRLFADGVVNVTVGIGYDEGDSHQPEIFEFKNTMLARGFVELDTSAATPLQLRALGIDPARLDPEVTYYVKDFKHEGKDVHAVVKLITPDTAAPKDRFGKALAEDEVVIYSGHGRVGSGPDFDDKHDPAGNFVIGKPYLRNYVALGANDLQKTKMVDDYQLMFFDGCNTKLYLDDLRKIPGNKDASNLDIVGANTDLDWGTSASDVTGFIDGLTGGKSIDEIKHELEVGNRKSPRDRTKHFLSDGFQDN
jgi:hypothetical protein